MAQFKRTLFATSYFGKSFVFTGEYFTRTVNSGDPFTGPVEVRIKATLPEMVYDMSNDAWTKPANWTYHATNRTRRTNTNGASIDFFACSDKIVLHFTKGDNNGIAKVTVKGDDNVEVVHQVNTATTNVFALNREYQNTWVKVSNTDGKQIILEKATARVGSIRAQAYAAPVFSGQRPTEENINTVFPNTSPIRFPNGMVPNAQGYIEGITTSSFTNQQAVVLKLILATSDTDPESSPVIDEITFYSGDIHSYSDDTGVWEAAINMNNVASQSNVQFRRTKRVDFNVEEPDISLSNPNWWDAYMAIRSTSRKITASDTSIPSDSNIASGTYWQPKTATYRKYRAVVVPRVSLSHIGNGGFTETKEEGALLYGPFSAQSMGYINTKITNWNDLTQHLGFPSVPEGTEVAIQLYDTPDVQTYLPVYERILSASYMPIKIPLSLPEAYQELYIRIVIRSTPGTQSPVLDYHKITNQMYYTKTIHYKNNLVSGLDNIAGDKALPSSPDGTKQLNNIAASNFTIPSNAVNRRYSLTYTPVYSNQMSVYFGNAQGIPLSNSSKLGNVGSMRVFSLVQPIDPRASTQPVNSNTLYWHYQYDGGTVNFPIKSEQEVGTDFTPDLLSRKKYRFQLLRGWPKEYFTLPINLDWQSVSDIVGHSVDVLKSKNPNVLLYNDKITAGVKIELPNNSLNENVTIKFKSTNREFTERSIWNGQTENDYTIADVSTSSTNVEEWVSEERFFAGILNPNNTDGSYIRTQKLGANGEIVNAAMTSNTDSSLSYINLAQEHGVAIEDLLLVNNLLHRYGDLDELTVAPGDVYIIPGKPALPYIPPEVWVETQNPYIVEIISNTVRKTFDNILLPDHTIIAGSDDEEAVSYTTKESVQKTHKLTRGNIRNGRDAIPYSNVNRVIRVVNDVNGTVYSPYVKVGATESGDYILDNNTINWNTAHANSKEPLAGETYTIQFTHHIVEDLKIIYTSDYKEKVSYDKLWRSPEVKVIDKVVGPDQELLIDLPESYTFAGYNRALQNVSYVVEDNDLWVQSSIVEVDGANKLLLTLNGKDPKRNWHPTIETGFYYLNNQEYYLYSEPIEHSFAEEEIPIIENISYTNNGMKLS